MSNKEIKEKIIDLLVSKCDCENYADVADQLLQLFSRQHKRRRKKNKKYV